MTRPPDPRPLRLLFCTTRYYPTPAGGAEHQARLQAEELVRRGHHVTVVCARTPGTRSEEIGGVSVVRLRHIDRRPLTRASYLTRLFGFVLRRAREFDIVHVHLANLQADAAGLAAAMRRVPTYVKVATAGHVGDIAEGGRAALVTRRFGLRNATRVQALSEDVRSELLEIGVQDERILRIPNGVDLARFESVSDQERLERRRVLGLPEQVVILLFVGRFSRWKGIGDLLDAWSKVRSPEGQLVVVGTAAAADSIGEIASEPGLIVRGWTDPPTEYLQAADVFVHPSHADGMSNVVLEALACRLPVVATELGATAELLEHGRESLLVPARNPPALAGALDLILGDRKLRERLAANASASAARYSIQAVVDRLEGAYGNMVGTAPGNNSGQRATADGGVVRGSASTSHFGVEG